MTKLVVMAVFDSAIQAYGRPIFVPAVGAGMRSFMDEVNRVQEGNALNAHSDDFELRSLGLFDEETGRFETPDEIVTVARGKDVKREG